MDVFVVIVGRPTKHLRNQLTSKVRYTCRQPRPSPLSLDVWGMMRLKRAEFRCTQWLQLPCQIKRETSAWISRSSPLNRTRSDLLRSNLPLL